MKIVPLLTFAAMLGLLPAGCSKQSAETNQLSKGTNLPVLCQHPTTFRHQMPWGNFGKRLGTQVVITGEYDYEAKLPNVLWVDSIDGIYRGAAVPIEIRGMQLHKGVHYTLQGYEAGEFSGVPAWVHSGDGPFQYRTFFVITKVVEPKATK